MRTTGSGELGAVRFAGLTGSGDAHGPGLRAGRRPVAHPHPAGELQTPAELLVGGALPPDPTFGRLLWTWQLSGVGLMVVLLGGVAYAVGVLRLRRRGDRWSPWRTASFAFGLLVVLYATCGGLGVYSEVLFSVHMVAHMALAMLAPIFLVLGAPPPSALRAPARCRRARRHRPAPDAVRGAALAVAGVVTHPVVAGLLFVGSLYVVYLGGLFGVLMDHHLGHAAMEIHFLASGLLFFEIIIGDSPVRRLPHIARLGLLMVTIAFHAFFAVAVMSTEGVNGARYYETLAYARDPLEDHTLAGSATWALGEVPMVLLIVVLLLQWWGDDSREARRRDRGGTAEAGARGVQRDAGPPLRRRPARLRALSVGAAPARARPCRRRRCGWRRRPRWCGPSRRGVLGDDVDPAVPGPARCLAGGVRRGQDAGLDQPHAEPGVEAAGDRVLRDAEVARERADLGVRRAARLVQADHAHVAPRERDRVGAHRQHGVRRHQPQAEPARAVVEPVRVEDLLGEQPQRPGGPLPGLGVDLPVAQEAGCREGDVASPRRTTTGPAPHSCTTTRRSGAARPPRARRGPSRGWGGRRRAARGPG